jgi:hypothetical protein
MFPASRRINRLNSSSSLLDPKIHDHLHPLTPDLTLACMLLQHISSDLTIIYLVVIASLLALQDVIVFSNDGGGMYNGANYSIYVAIIHECRDITQAVVDNLKALE